MPALVRACDDIDAVACDCLRLREPECFDGKQRRTDYTGVSSLVCQQAEGCGTPARGWEAVSDLLQDNLKRGAVVDRDTCASMLATLVC